MRPSARLALQERFPALSGLASWSFASPVQRGRTSRIKDEQMAAFLAGEASSEGWRTRHGKKTVNCVLRAHSAQEVGRPQQWKGAQSVQ